MAVENIGTHGIGHDSSQRRLQRADERRPGRAAIAAFHYVKVGHGQEQARRVRGRRPSDIWEIAYAAISGRRLWRAPGHAVVVSLADTDVGYEPTTGIEAARSFEACETEHAVGIERIGSERLDSLADRALPDERPRLPEISRPVQLAITRILGNSPRPERPSMEKQAGCVVL